MLDETPFSSLSEFWSEIREFPRYSVSNRGNVVNNDTGRAMRQPLNTRGIPTVGLMRNKVQFKRSVTLLVAQAFVPRPNEVFDTPINLDGDRTNNYFANIMWRPLWFARRYHDQFPFVLTKYHVPIVDVEANIVYANSWDAAIKNGLLECEIEETMQKNSYVWPTGQVFREA
jgi:hypothetical protein